MYTVTDIGGPFEPVAINNAGQVIGNCSSADFSHITTAYLYSGGQLQSLGIHPGGVNSNLAAGINNAGDFVGYSYEAQLFGGPSNFAGFLYTAGQLQAVPALAKASGINDSGQIVGTSASGRAILVTGDQTQDLGTLGGAVAYPTAINSAGQVVGMSMTAAGQGEAFLYTGGQMLQLGSADLSVVGVYPIKINDLGQVVGTTAGQHAFLYTAGEMQDLGTLPGSSVSHAYGISGSGQVVGYADTPTGVHGFLYNGSTMIDLNTVIDPSSGWTLGFATAINDLGQIVGSGTNSLGQAHAFLLTPVPEPTTLCLLALGSISFLRRTRSR